MTNKNNQYQFDSVDLILFLWKKRLPLILLTGLAAVISIIVSFSIDNKYESEVILFPTASGSVSHDLLSVNVIKKSILNLGEEEEVEQLLQVLNSDDIAGRIIRDYDLINHYEIDLSGKFPYSKLEKEFKKNITFTPTKFMSVKISVLDKDPIIAANIANGIASLVDTVRHKMQKDRAVEALALVEKEYNTFLKQIQILEDSLTVIRSYGIIDYEQQAAVLTEAYSQAILDGNQRAENKLKQKLDILAKYGGAYVSIRDYLEEEFEQLSILKMKYAEAVVDATQTLPTKFVVNKAVVAEKKSYPVRWLIVVVSTFSAFIMSLIFLVVFDAVKKRMTEIKEKL